MTPVRPPFSRGRTTDGQVMLRLYTLGAFSLRTDDLPSPGLDLRLAPRDAALLVYLALAGPGSPRSRDELVGVFWPDRPDRRARAALSQGLYRLRQALGDDLIRTSGEREVALDWSRVWCDAQAFEEAAQAGRLEDALDLCRGELLSAFHVSDAPEFERWLDGMRERIRSRVVGAARALAERHATAGNLSGTAHALRQALAWMPWDEHLLRDLVLALSDQGDRTGAIREYDAFRRRLAADLELEPSADITALVNQLRTGHDPGALPLKPDIPSPVAKAGVRRIRWRVPAIAAALLALAALWTGQRPAAAGGSGDATRLVVLPFEVSGNGRASYLGEGLSHLLTSRLEVPGHLTPVDSRTLLTALHRPGWAGRRGVATGHRLATELGARLFVLGTVIAAGERLEISVAVHDSSGQALVTATADVADEAGVFDAVDALAVDLLDGILRDGGRAPSSGARMTTSLAAFKAAVGGEQAFRRGDFGAAVTAFAQAVQEDSLFARAWYDLGTAAAWAGRYDLLPASFERGAALRDRLTERDRLLLDGKRGIFTLHSAVEAERHFRAAVARDPADAEALYELTDLLFHQVGWGITPGELRPGFERVLDIDPAHGGAILHLARLEAMEQRRPALDSLMALATAFRAEDGLLAIELRSLRAFATGDPADQSGVLAALRTLPDERLAQFVSRTLVFTGRLEEADRLTALLVERTRSPRVRVLGHVLLGHIAAGRGRLAEARHQLAAASRLDAGAGAIGHALLAAVPDLPLPAGELDSLRRALEGVRQTSTVESEILGALELPLLPLMLRAVLSVRLGDRPEAERLAGELVVVDSLRGRQAARVVEALLLERDGKAAEAMQVLGGPEARTEPALISDPSGLEIQLRATLLAQLGQDEAALRWSGSMAQALPFSVLHLASSHLRRAVLYERLGRFEQARWHRARFAALRAGADPGVEIASAGEGRRDG